VTLALLFDLGIYFCWGWIAPGSDKTPADASMTFLAGYLLEESLSIDNVFAFALVFVYFRTERQYQHRVLFWGVIGAIVMRGIIILAGAALVSRFQWILYIFGVILLFSGFKLAFGKEESGDPGNNPIVRFTRKIFPVSPDYDGPHFLTHKWGRRMVTPLFIVLLVVEVSDLVFASDSLPAIFAVTQDPLLIFTSNVFAILGLRSLYFVLAEMMGRFRHLNIGIAVVLVFIGVKLLIKHWYEIPIVGSLAFIVVALGTSVATSMLCSSRKNGDNPSNP
jgi:tellurite resistance protein TerC